MACTGIWAAAGHMPIGVCIRETSTKLDLATWEASCLPASVISLVRQATITSRSVLPSPAVWNPSLSVRIRDSSEPWDEAAARLGDLVMVHGSSVAWKNKNPHARQWSRSLPACPGAAGARPRPCLVSYSKFFHRSHRIFRHMHRILNVDKKIN